MTQTNGLTKSIKYIIPILSNNNINEISQNGNQILQDITIDFTIKISNIAIELLNMDKERIISSKHIISAIKIIFTKNSNDIIKRIHFILNKFYSNYANKENNIKKFNEKCFLDLNSEQILNIFESKFQSFTNITMSKEGKVAITAAVEFVYVFFI